MAAFWAERAVPATLSYITRRYTNSCAILIFDPIQVVGFVTGPCACSGSCKMEG